MSCALKCLVTGSSRSGLSSETPWLEERFLEYKIRVLDSVTSSYAEGRDGSCGLKISPQFREIRMNWPGKEFTSLSCVARIVRASLLLSGSAQ